MLIRCRVVGVILGLLVMGSTAAPVADVAGKFYIFNNNSYCGDDRWACIENPSDCLAVTVGQCAAMLYTYQGTNYSSILFSPSTDNASTTASLFSDDYCGKTVKSASFPNALTPNPGIFTSYYQWNDDDYVKQTWKAMCASIP